MINFQQILFEFANYVERVLSLANEGPRFDRAVINATKKWMLDPSEINDREAKSVPSLAILCLRYAPMSLIMALNGVLHSFTVSLDRCRIIADSTSFSSDNINRVEWARSVASDISDFDSDNDSGRVLPLLFTLGLAMELFLSFYFSIFLTSQSIVKIIYSFWGGICFYILYNIFFHSSISCYSCDNCSIIHDVSRVLRFIKQLMIHYRNHIYLSINLLIVSS